MNIVGLLTKNVMEIGRGFYDIHMANMMCLHMIQLTPNALNRSGADIAVFQTWPQLFNFDRADVLYKPTNSNFLLYYPNFKNMISFKHSLQLKIYRPNFGGSLKMYILK